MNTFCSCSHVGSAYEMGYAHGELMSERAQGMVNDVWNYLEEEVVRSESPSSSS